MQLSLNLTGTITIVHKIEPAPGASPAATQADLEALGEKLMSALSDKLAALGTTADAAIARVQSDVTALKAQIAALQATVDSGGATPDDLAALDTLNAKLAALDPTQPATLPPPGDGTATPPGDGTAPTPPAP